VLYEFENTTVLSNPLHLLFPEPSPRLSDDVVRLLYREGRRRGMQMTRLADDLLRQAFGSIPKTYPALHVCGEEPENLSLREVGVA
jgi:hypothetical protein